MYRRTYVHVSEKKNQNNQQLRQNENISNFVQPRLMEIVLHPSKGASHCLGPVTKRILSREHQWLRKLYSTMTSSLSNLSIIQLVILFIPIALVLPVQSSPSPGGSSFGGVVRLPRYINSSISVSNQLRPAVFLENIARGTWDPGVAVLTKSTIQKNSPQDSNNLFTNTAVLLHWFRHFQRSVNRLRITIGKLGCTWNWQTQELRMLSWTGKNGQKNFLTDFWTPQAVTFWHKFWG